VASKTSKTEAEAKFARMEKRATDAARAVSDAEAEAKRVEDNTARLKALRLAKEAKDKEAASRVVAAPVAAKAKPKAKPRAIPVKKLNAKNDG
jgi:hypothetical protein